MLWSAASSFVHLTNLENAVEMLQSTKAQTMLAQSNSCTTCPMKENTKRRKHSPDLVENLYVTMNAYFQ